MRVQAITRENGWGMSKDVQVLREALPDAQVDFTPCDGPARRGHWHWNFHLELVKPQHLSATGVNVLVPNAEWFEKQWIRYLGSFDVILAKTRDCEAVFKAIERGKHADRVVYIGWTSPDPGIRVDHDRDDFVHTAGNSSAKGTEAVLTAAFMVPEAQVTVTWMHKSRKAIPKNVVFKYGRTPDEQFKELRRAPLHLCPSTYEGFGHYLNEARAMGACIVTTDAAPMNELCQEVGYLVPHCNAVHNHEALEHHVCADRLAEAMRTALNTPKEVRAEIGQAAREAYEQDRAAFHERLQALVK